MGSDVNTVRETTSARAMDVAIASGDRSERFFFARFIIAQWDAWARTTGTDGLRRCDARPETRERSFFLFLVDASRRRGE